MKDLLKDNSNKNEEEVYTIHFPEQINKMNKKELIKELEKMFLNGNLSREARKELVHENGMVAHFEYTKAEKMHISKLRKFVKHFTIYYDDLFDE